MQTALWFCTAAVAFISLLAMAELVARRWSLRPELGRKLAHIVGGMMSAALPVILPFPAIVILSGAFVPFMVVTRRVGVFPLIHGAERSSYGEIYFPLGVLGTAALVPHPVEYAFGILVMGIADAVASLSGEKFGQRSYRLLAGRKTYVGSAAFLATTFGLGLLALQALGEVSGPAVLVVSGIAGVLTLEEALIGGGADNVVLPISAAALLRALI